MKFRNIILFIFALTFLSGCGPKTDISPKEMSAMLREMYLVDQYIDIDSELSELADSTFVYLPIIERYGYTVEAFTASVEFYRHNPKMFMTILENVKESIEDELYENQVAVKENNARMEDINLESDSIGNDSGKRPLFKRKVKGDDVPVETEFVFEGDNDIESVEQQDDVEVVKEKKRVKEKKLSKKELKELKNKWD